MRPEAAKREREGERAPTFLSGRSLEPGEEGAKLRPPSLSWQLDGPCGQWAGLTTTPTLPSLSYKTQVKHSVGWHGTFGSQTQ